MFDEATYPAESSGELPFSALMEILASIEDFEDRYGARVDSFGILGGDPLLRPDWAEFLGELHRRDRKVLVAGNPETLTDESIQTLSELGVRAYELSLDGLERTHDWLRSPGSFRRTLRGIQMLDRAGMHSIVRFTLTSENADELLPLLRYLGEETSTGRFEFMVACPSGNARDSLRQIGGARLRQLLGDFLAEKRRLRDEGHRIIVSEREVLGRLTRFEEGTFYPIGADSSPVVSGCPVGWTPPNILSDGTCLVCPLIPVAVGRMPEQSFEQVFLGSEMLRRFRRPEYWGACGSCDFYSVCRGCMAHSYGFEREGFEADSLCFRSSIDRRTDEGTRIAPGLAMDASLAQEWDLVAARARWRHRMQQRLTTDSGFFGAFTSLIVDGDAMRQFLLDPRGYASTNALDLDEDQLAFMVFRICDEKMSAALEVETELGGADPSGPLSRDLFMQLLQWSADRVADR